MQSSTRSHSAQAEVAVDYDTTFRELRGINNRLGIPSPFQSQVEAVAEAAVVASHELQVCNLDP